MEIALQFGTHITTEPWELVTEIVAVAAAIGGFYFFWLPRREAHYERLLDSANDRPDMIARLQKTSFLQHYQTAMGRFLALDKSFFGSDWRKLDKNSAIHWLTRFFYGWHSIYGRCLMVALAYPLLLLFWAIFLKGGSGWNIAGIDLYWLYRSGIILIFLLNLACLIIGISFFQKNIEKLKFFFALSAFQNKLGIDSLYFKLFRLFLNFGFVVVLPALLSLKLLTTGSSINAIIVIVLSTLVIALSSLVFGKRAGLVSIISASSTAAIYAAIKGGNVIIIALSGTIPGGSIGIGNGIAVILVVFYILLPTINAFVDGVSWLLTRFFVNRIAETESVSWILLELLADIFLAIGCLICLTIGVPVIFELADFFLQYFQLSETSWRSTVASAQKYPFGEGIGCDRNAFDNFGSYICTYFFWVLGDFIFYMERQRGGS